MRTSLGTRTALGRRVAPNGTATPGDSKGRGCLRRLQAPRHAGPQAELGIQPVASVAGGGGTEQNPDHQHGARARDPCAEDEKRERRGISPAHGASLGYPYLGGDE